MTLPIRCADFATRASPQTVLGNQLLFSQIVEVFGTRSLKPEVQLPYCRCETENWGEKGEKKATKIISLHRQK